MFTAEFFWKKILYLAVRSGNIHTFAIPFVRIDEPVLRWIGVCQCEQSIAQQLSTPRKASIRKGFLVKEFQQGDELIPVRENLFEVKERSREK